MRCRIVNAVYTGDLIFALFNVQFIMHDKALGFLKNKRYDLIIYNSWDITAIETSRE